MAGERVTVKKNRGSDRGGGERSTYPEGSQRSPPTAWREQKAPSPRVTVRRCSSFPPVFSLVGLPGSGK